MATGGQISIIGHVTKDELLRYLSDTEAGNGFAGGLPRHPASHPFAYFMRLPL